MTPEEARELRWCTEANCQCDATFHLPPTGTLPATSEDEARLDEAARPIKCKCQSFRFAQWTPWMAQQHTAHTPDRCGFFRLMTIAWAGDKPTVSIVWLDSPP